MTDKDSKGPQNNHSSPENSGEADSVSRRAFIKRTGWLTGGVLGGAVLGGLIGNPFSVEQTNEPVKSKESEQVDYSETRMFFKRQTDFDVLSHATERIFPEDDHGPGAIELGVPYFIDKQLAGSWGNNAKMYMKKPFQDGEIPLTKRDLFLQGVRKINDVSKEQHDIDFVDLEADQQNEILTLFETGQIEMEIVNSTAFFFQLIQSTLEGVYSDPMYGGNKNMKGWAMKEFPGPRMSHRDRVENEFEVYEKMEQKSLKTHM